MESTPEPGWYADPADTGRHRYWDGTAWTATTRPAGVSTLPVDGPVQPKRTGLFLGLGLLAVVGIGVTVALVLNSDGKVTIAKPDPTPSVTESVPAPISTTDPSEVIIPEGWSLYTSETGVMSYAVDPTWIDLLAPGDQDYLHSLYLDFPDSKTEYSGVWLLSPSATGGEGILLYIVSYTDGKAPGLARALARSYINAEVYENLEVVLDEEYINERGYSGWRVDYTGDYLGVPYCESVIALKTGKTVIYVYGTSDEDFESIMPGMLAMADSIVVHHPPTEN